MLFTPSARFLCLFVFVFCLGGCATLTPRFENPAVEIISLKLLPGGALEQRFDVGLRVTNPNARALQLKGMSYSISINDFKLASGVTSNIPRIEGYASGDLVVPVTTSLVSSLRLAQSLMKSETRQINYRLEASLDTGLLWLPRLKIVEEGEVPLGLPQNGSTNSISY